MSSYEDETIHDICKEFKIKIPQKNVKQKSVPQKTIYPIANLENLDENNLTILILHNNGNETVSVSVIQNSPQILTDDNLNLITGNETSDISLTSDVWTSTNNNELFISVAGHYITEKWEKHNYLLNRTNFPENHSAKNISQKNK
ncbi:hypothetical protein HHI36_023306 [Cryptolaemus montrouzieri]|uniref:Uncharacterized protein n=1 Tax=Cryptolaemus montrouzieri TaxID=559131 RepID=A0ABD2PGG4_9CUCU